MNYIKLAILLLALPTLAGAAQVQVVSEQVDEQSCVCDCSCSCFGSITTGFKNYREKRKIARQQEEARKERKAKITHMLEANPARLTIVTHTNSTDLTHAREALGLATGSDSAKHEIEVAREVREDAYEMQARKAGVPVQDWKMLDNSALARGRRPVIHRLTLLDRLEAQKEAEQEVAEENRKFQIRARVASDVFSDTPPLSLDKLASQPRLYESDEKQPEPLTLPGQVEADAVSEA